jgi:hypothetical protein
VQGTSDGMAQRLMRRVTPSLARWGAVGVLLHLMPMPAAWMPLGAWPTAGVSAGLGVLVLIVAALPAPARRVIVAVGDPLGSGHPARAGHPDGRCTPRQWDPTAAGRPRPRAPGPVRAPHP